IGHSLVLIAAADSVALPVVADIGAASGDGEAICEAARGKARLWLRLEAGKVAAAKLQTPSVRNLALVQGMTAEQELGDALVAVASLDISPWEISQETAYEPGHETGVGSQVGAP
ncbi:MAG: hypothetical protein ACC631_06190, partial [Halocynthiibacter sp.]